MIITLDLIDNNNGVVEDDEGKAAGRFTILCGLQ